jgi:hypothetical protein
LPWPPWATWLRAKLIRAPTDSSFILIHVLHSWRQTQCHTHTL